MDVERVRDLPDAEDVARRFFSSGERQALALVPAAERTRAFFEAWTQKEAFLKALGSGLARPLDSFEVSLTPGEPARLLRTADPSETESFSLRALDLAPGYVAALAVHASDFSVRCVRSRPDRRFAEVGA